MRAALNGQPGHRGGGEEREVEMKIDKIREQIKIITAGETPVVAKFDIKDTSVQAELRLSCDWSIAYPVDAIHYPKPVDKSISWLQPDPWIAMRAIVQTIDTVAQLKSLTTPINTIPINSKTKSGPARRAAAREAFEIEHGQSFLAEYRKATSKKHLAKITRKIADLQAQQKALLQAMREHNSAVMLARKSAAAERKEANALALTEGRFWDCDKDALKDYFNPPFARNYLADVSEHWRAALFTEMASTAWKAGKGDWRHKNIGTGRGYLCGIDDNGDEWGHHVDLRRYLERDQYDDYGYVASVEDAMSSLFELPVSKLANCERQGDLLFCRETIPAGVDLTEQPEPWEIRRSHTLTSEGLKRNGRYFRSAAPILVSHTSHAAVSLPAGDYRLYAIADAD